MWPCQQLSCPQCPIRASSRAGACTARMANPVIPCPYPSKLKSANMNLPSLSPSGQYLLLLVVITLWGISIKDPGC